MHIFESRHFLERSSEFCQVNYRFCFVFSLLLKFPPSFPKFINMVLYIKHMLASFWNIYLYIWWIQIPSLINIIQNFAKELLNTVRRGGEGDLSVFLHVGNIKLIKCCYSLLLCNLYNNMLEFWKRCNF